MISEKSSHLELAQRIMRAARNGVEPGDEEALGILKLALELYLPKKRYCKRCPGWWSVRWPVMEAKACPAGHRYWGTKRVRVW